jgi:alkylhydroperoxidase/carboxymuconolactone decarboxylase family protein YurZ
MSKFTKARNALTTRILEGAGKAPPAQRRAAFENTGLAEPLRTLIHKVAHHAHKIVDADIAAVRQSGLGEDEIFELVVCAAVGQASRQYDTAMAALEAVTERRGNASRNPR